MDAGEWNSLELKLYSCRQWGKSLRMPNKGYFKLDEETMCVDLISDNEFNKCESSHCCERSINWEEIIIKRKHEISN